MEKMINEIKVSREMLEILGDLLDKYTIDYLMETVRDKDGSLVRRWMILKERAMG